MRRVLILFVLLVITGCTGGRTVLLGQMPTPEEYRSRLRIELGQEYTANPGDIVLSAYRIQSPTTGIVEYPYKKQVGLPTESKNMYNEWVSFLGYSDGVLRLQYKQDLVGADAYDQELDLSFDLKKTNTVKIKRFELEICEASQDMLKYIIRKN